MINAGVGAEVAAAIQADSETFIRLEAPVLRVAGWSIHNPLMFEAFNIPDVASKSPERLRKSFEVANFLQGYMMALKRLLNTNSKSPLRPSMVSYCSMSSSILTAAHGVSFSDTEKRS